MLNERRRKNRKKKINKTVLPEKVIIFLLRMGEVGCSKVNVAPAWLVGSCCRTLETVKAPQAPSAKQGT